MYVYFVQYCGYVKHLLSDCCRTEIYASPQCRERPPGVVTSRPYHNPIIWRLINQALKLVSRRAEVAFWTLHNLLPAAEVEKEILCSLTSPERSRINCSWQSQQTWSFGGRTKTGNAPWVEQLYRSRNLNSVAFPLPCSKPFLHLLMGTLGGSDCRKQSGVTCLMYKNRISGRVKVKQVKTSLCPPWRRMATWKFISSIHKMHSRWSWLGFIIWPLYHGEISWMVFCG